METTEAQKANADGDVKGKDNVEDLADENEDSSDEANENTATEAEDDAEDSTDETTGFLGLVSLYTSVMYEITYPTTAKRVQRVV